MINDQDTFSPGRMSYLKSGTRAPRPGTQLIGRTQDTRPETIKMGHKTRDSEPNSEVRPGTQDPRADTQKVDF